MSDELFDGKDYGYPKELINNITTALMVIRDLATFNGFKINVMMEDHWIKLYVYNKDELYLNRNFYLQDTYKFEKERDSIYNEILDFMKSLKEK